MNAFAQAAHCVMAVINDAGLPSSDQAETVGQSCVCTAKHVFEGGISSDPRNHSLKKTWKSMNRFALETDAGFRMLQDGNATV